MLDIKRLIKTVAVVLIILGVPLIVSLTVEQVWSAICLFTSADWWSDYGTAAQLGMRWMQGVLFIATPIGVASFVTAIYKSVGSSNDHPQ